MLKYILYECGICDSYHPWEWDGDCRDDANRYTSPEDCIARLGYDNVEIRTMEDRVEADNA